LLRLAATLVNAQTLPGLSYAGRDAEVKQCVPVDLAEVARDVNYLFHAPIQTANASLTVGEMPVVLGDLKQLA